MKRLYWLTCCSLLLATLIFFFKKREPSTIAAGQGLVVPKNWLAVNKSPLTPQEGVRPADQTFLTFPEWFLVFSPEEQANYFRSSTATSFPFTWHIEQIWQSYHIVNDQIKDNFPVNRGYHFMIWVIGSSATVEYSFKAWYETVIGRLTDTKAPVTDEDKFNARYTQRYVDFIKDRPWYEFDFGKESKLLQDSVPFFGGNFLRKIERRYLLTTELIVKQAYGKLIGLGTKQVYDVALPTTAVVLDDGKLQYLPRYDKFADSALSIAKGGHSFREIAGNTSAILVTVLGNPNGAQEFENAKVIFTQPPAAGRSRTRIALAIPVSSLDKLLKQMDRDHLKVEHVFDF